MADKRELYCSNTTCGEIIKKNKKGLYPKRCVECDELVCEVKVLEIFRCPHCSEELSKNKKGQYPKTCPECNEPTNPFAALKVQAIFCSNCKEEILKNAKGKYPKFCQECGKPVMSPMNQHVEELNCPSCGEERVRSPKTQKLANVCTECGYDYSKSKLAIYFDPKLYSYSFELQAISCE